MLRTFFFPASCIGCRRELPTGALCAICIRLLPIPQTPQCPHCSQRLPFGILPKQCREDLRIDRLFIGGPYANPLLRASIDALKYDAIRDIAAPLGRILVQVIRNASSSLANSPLLLPVPLHQTRLRTRGFNQSALIARAISQETQIALSEKLVVRMRSTEQQAKLPRAQRQQNMQNVFRAIPSSDLRNRTIILVDDVITTGATMRDAARALRRAGAHEIWAATVAQG